MSGQGLLIIDMLNEYLLPEGRLYCAACRKIIDNIVSCAGYARENKIPVIYVNTCLETGDEPLALKWGLHAVKGSYGARVATELEPREGDSVITKQSYNGFHNTRLDAELRRLKVTNLAVTGIHTHVCVLLTAAAAFEHGYSVDVLKDCIAASSPENHNSRLRFFETHIGRLISSAEWKSLY